MINGVFKQAKQNPEVYVEAVQLTNHNCDEIFTRIKSIHGNSEIYKTQANRYRDDMKDLFFVTIYIKNGSGEVLARAGDYIVIYNNKTTKKETVVTMTESEYHSRYSVVTDGSSSLYGVGNGRL